MHIPLFNLKESAIIVGKLCQHCARAKNINVTKDVMEINLTNYPRVFFTPVQHLVMQTDPPLHCQIL